MPDPTNAEKLMNSAMDAKDAEIADLRNRLNAVSMRAEKIRSALVASEKELAEIKDQIRLFRELLAAVKPIYRPLGDEAPNSGNPCLAPSPEQGRRIAAAIQQLEPFA